MREKNEKQTPGAEPIPPELVEQAKAGDQAAFTELYERTSTMLYRTIRSMVRDEDLVWDIQQDSYVRAWKGLSELQASEAFLPWLRRIAVNTALNALNKKVPLTFTELAGDGDEREPEIPDLNIETQPELALDRKETSRLVRELLAELSPEQQAIVGMHYYEDMPIGEIAKTLRIAPGTVKTLLFRGRKRIEAGVRALEKQGVKLYGLSPLPFLLALLGRLEPSAQAEKKTLAAVLEQAPAAPVTVTALTAGQAFLKGLGTKLLAGALALSLIAVGGKLAYDALADRKLPPIGIERPTAEETLAPKDTIGLVEADTVSPVEEDTAPETALPKLYAPEDAPENACGPNLTWSFDETTGTLTIEGSGPMYDYAGYDVILNDTNLSPWSSVSTLITSVSAANELTSIGDRAFSECRLLKSVLIPECVTSIGDYAFSWCSGLTSATIPQSVTTIGDGAFEGCTELNAFSVHPDNASYAADEAGVLYSKDYTSLIAYPGRKSGAFAIPNSVTIIEKLAFCECTGLTSVTIPESVTTIGDYAFSGCTGLTLLTIPDGVTTIGDGAFSGCEGLTSVTIPEGVTSIGKYAFEYCTGLTSVTIPESVTAIGDGAFRNCSMLTSVIIPEGVSTIGNYMFLQCPRLTLVTIPEGVTSIGDYAFCSCNGLTSVTIPDGVTIIGDYAFSSCSGLTSLLISEGVTTIGDWAFSDCTGLTSVSIPDGVTTIGDYAFYNCTGLTSVTIPEGVIAIGERAFYNCTGLTSVTIPEGVIAIGDYAFLEYPDLTIRGVPGSEAERYADKNDIPFEAIP